MKKKMYIVMKLRLWKNVELENAGGYKLPFPVQLIQPPDGAIGFAEVYDNLEKALKAAEYKIELVKEIEEAK